jgi:hypothetical protein
VRRQLVVGLPWLALALVYALQRAPHARAGLAACATLALAVVIYNGAAYPQKEPWREVGAQLTRDVQPGDEVRLAPDFIQFALGYYYRGPARLGVSLSPPPARVWLVVYDAAFYDPAGRAAGALETQYARVATYDDTPAIEVRLYAR